MQSEATLNKAVQHAEAVQLPTDTAAAASSLLATVSQLRVEGENDCRTVYVR